MSEFEIAIDEWAEAQARFAVAIKRKVIKIEAEIDLHKIAGTAHHGSGDCCTPGASTSSSSSEPPRYEAPTEESSSSSY